MDVFGFRANEPVSLLDLDLRGPRLRLRPTKRDDGEVIFREFTSRVTEFMIPRPPQRLEETLEFIEASRARAAAGRNVQLTILSTEGEFLGCCGLHGDGQVRTPELGIWLKEAAQGRGYGPEAIKILCEWAFQCLYLDYIVYPVDKRNRPSRKIPEAMGGRPMGEKRMTGFGGNELDLVLYRIDPPAQLQSLA